MGALREGAFGGLGELSPLSLFEIAHFKLLHYLSFAVGWRLDCLPEFPGWEISLLVI